MIPERAFSDNSGWNSFLWQSAGRWVFSLGLVYVIGHMNLHLDMTPSEGNLCIRQPLGDHEYIGTVGLWDKNLRRIQMLAATHTLLHLGA